MFKSVHSHQGENIFTNKIKSNPSNWLFGENKEKQTNKNICHNLENKKYIMENKNNVLSKHIFEKVEIKSCVAHDMQTM